MKTKMNFLAMLIATIILGACSSSMQVSKTSKYQGDDLYYNPSTSYSTEKSDATASTNDGSVNSRFADLEKKYAEILSSDTTGNLDTVIYKSGTEKNSYERVLSTTYEDSYERRLRGRANPYYRLGSWSAYYSDDYWYASAYDPAFYNVIVMGTEVWVEPNYISSMFGHSYYRPWMYGSRFYFGYPNNYWGYNGWYSPWNSFGYGYSAVYWHGNTPQITVNPYYANSTYGLRPGQGTLNYGSRNNTSGVVGENGINQRRSDLSSLQVTSQSTTIQREQRGKDSGSQARGGNGRQNPENINQGPQSGRRDGSLINVREPVRGGNGNPGQSRDGVGVNPTRGNSGVGRDQSSNNRGHNPSYTMPNAGNSREFNNSRNYPSNEGTRDPGRGSNATSIAQPRGTANPSNRSSYSPPARGDGSASTSSRNPNNSSSGNSSSGGRGSSGVSSGGSNSGSSSGSTSGRGSGGSSSSSSSNESGRSRR